MGTIGLVNLEIQYFWFVTWLPGRCVTWSFVWVLLILSYDPAKFVVHSSCESGDKTFFTVTWPRYWNVTWLYGWGPLILSHHPAKFGVHRLYQSGDNNVCNINSNSKCNSNSNAEIPIPRFTNGRLIGKLRLILKFMTFRVGNKQIMTICVL